MGSKLAWEQRVASQKRNLAFRPRLKSNAYFNGWRQHLITVHNNAPYSCEVINHVVSIYWSNVVIKRLHQTLTKQSVNYGICLKIVIVSKTISLNGCTTCSYLLEWGVSLCIRRRVGSNISKCFIIFISSRHCLQRISEVLINYELISINCKLNIYFL